MIYPELNIGKAKWKTVVWRRKMLREISDLASLLKYFCFNLPHLKRKK